jgi:Transcriptional regulators
MALTARAVAYEVLQRGIASGLYPPGSWLREEDIAAAAGVSRTPVREALHRLQAEGLVQLLRNRGAMVIGWTAHDLDDIYDLRTMLEGYGVRRAAQFRDGVDFPALVAMCDEMEELLPGADEDDLQRIGSLCIDFHITLNRASGNRQLLTILPSLLATPFVREAFHHHTHADLQRAFAYHREILEAVDAGDGEWADGVMRAHLRAGRLSLRRMEQDRPAAGPDGSGPGTSGNEWAGPRIRLAPGPPGAE